MHGGAQRIATIGNAKAKNVILFIGDGMGDSEITVARNYLHGVNGTFQGLDKIGQPGALQTSTGKAAESGVGQYTTFSLGGSSNDSLMAKDSKGQLTGSKTAGVITPGHRLPPPPAPAGRPAPRPTTTPCPWTSRATRSSTSLSSPRPTASPPAT